MDIGTKSSRTFKATVETEPQHLGKERFRGLCCLGEGWLVGGGSALV